MPFFTESTSTAVAEQIKLRKPRSQINQEPFFSAETDPNPHITTRPSKSAISSLFLLPFSTNNVADTNPTTTTNKKKGSTFRGLGCTAGAEEQVSVPAVIRSSAEWEEKRVKKKKNQQKHKRKKDESNKKANHQGLAEGSNSNSNNNNSKGKDDNNGGSFNPGNCMVIQDVWCGPGIGLSADPVVGSVDCVVAKRNVPGRGKVDNGEKIIQRERERESERERERERERSCLMRRAAVNPETLSFFDTDPAFAPPRLEPEVFGTRYYRHFRHPSPDGFAEIMMLQNRIIMGGRLDQFREWRLDIDHMSYEELLALGDRIGYVCTGLKEDEISRCISKIKLPITNKLSSHKSISMDKKCSICQEEYETNDELGKLECGHGFHIQCIKQWLSQKNICPVCKTEPLARG